MRRRLPRRALLVAAALLIGLAGAFVFLRDSSMFAIEDVAVHGVSGPDAVRVETALRQAAQNMTTLNVDADELKNAARAYPTVKAVRVQRDLPNGVKLTVIEKRPVAIVETAGRKVPLAADGRLLQGATPPDDVPRLDLDRIGGTRVTDTRGRQLVALAATAPGPLRARAERAHVSDKGLTLEMGEGPDLYFGTAGDLPAKWRAVARVLADPTSEGASYIDVRVPGRAAAGGLAPLVDQGATSEAPANELGSTSAIG